MHVAILYSKGHGMKPLQIRAMIAQYYPSTSWLSIWTNLEIYL